MMVANRDSKEEERKELASTCLSLLKTFDQLVPLVGDATLSREWRDTWPDVTRQESERNRAPIYVFGSYSRFLERLSVLIKADMEALQSTPGIRR